MTSDSDDQPSSRKRARTDGGGSRDGGRKQRGRPRVDTQDETAADVSIENFFQNQIDSLRFSFLILFLQLLSLILMGSNFCLQSKMGDRFA